MFSELALKKKKKEAKTKLISAEKCEGMWRYDACMHMWGRIYLEAHPEMRQICFNETMQVDNVSCKCIKFPPIEVEKSPPQCY